MKPPRRSRTNRRTHAYIWVFDVRRDCLDAFRRYYGEAGAWAALFRRGRGYLGTQLLEDQDDPLRFVTIDTWKSVEDYEAFRQAYAAEYAALDRACERLTTRETQIGHFSSNRASGARPRARQTPRRRPAPG